MKFYRHVSYKISVSNPTIFKYLNVLVFILHILVFLLVFLL